ncbi:glycosyltransferase [bacterium]|nr:glycosyltransferase [bacterium]
MPEKVLIICTQLEAGGAQNAAVELSKQLEQMGYSAPLLFLYQKRMAFAHFSNMMILSRKKNVSLINYPGIFISLYIHLKKEKPAAVITFTHYANILACAAAFLSGVKTRIASQRNPLQSYPVIARLLDPVFGFLPVYTNITMVSQSVQASFSNLSTKYLKKCRVIYNGVHMHEMIQHKTSKPVKAGNVGRLAKQKNQQLLIELAHKHRDLELHIAGEGELRHQLEQQIARYQLQDRVFLHGELPKQQLEEFYKSLDLFLFPSHFEGMSNALLEAMSFGLPIIASNIEPNREVLQNGHETAGICLHPLALKDWSETLESILKSPDKLLDMRLKSYQKAQTFSYHAMSKKFVDLLNEN